MIRRFAAMLVALMALSGGTPVMAQDLTSEALSKIMETELPPETEKLAHELIQISGTARLYDSLLPNVADKAKNGFIRSNPQMQLGIIAIVDRVAVELVSRRPELDAYLARVWAAAFTADEMRELIAFYKSETGQKFARNHPKILGVQTAAADEWAKDVAQELDQRVREELRKAAAVEQKRLQGGAAEDAAPQQ